MEERVNRATMIYSEKNNEEKRENNEKIYEI